LPTTRTGHPCSSKSSALSTTPPAMTGPSAIPGGVGPARGGATGRPRTRPGCSKSAGEPVCRRRPPRPHPPP
jgi:hypothetical protein